ncbi:MAG: ADP-ribose pyrophosphatase [Planctomycetes bacterium ADurb.Bin126]|nr:MAG: ADP-ribose pyrophosphatase [Planctomycetes bacterium ADurb.Bin126]
MRDMSQTLHVGAEKLYRGAVLELRRVSFRGRDGGTITKDMIHHRGAAVILPVLGDGRMVLIRCYRYAMDDFLYELPAGTLEEGEDPARCAARELAEETGYQARRLELLGRLAASPGTSDEVLHTYLADDLTAGPQDLERDEDIRVEPLTQEQVRQMLLDGTIRDAKTAAAIGLYWLRKGVH